MATTLLYAACRSLLVRAADGRRREIYRCIYLALSLCHIPPSGLPLSPPPAAPCAPAAPWWAPTPAPTCGPPSWAAPARPAPPRPSDELLPTAGCCCGSGAKLLLLCAGRIPPLCAHSGANSAASTCLMAARLHLPSHRCSPVSLLSLPLPASARTPTTTATRPCELPCLGLASKLMHGLPHTCVGNHDASLVSYVRPSVPLCLCLQLRLLPLRRLDQARHQAVQRRPHRVRRRCRS